MTKRTAFFCLAAVNIAAAALWRAEGLGVGASIVSTACALTFLYAGVRRIPLRMPSPNATPKEKAEYNLRRIAAMLGADQQFDGGYSLRVGEFLFTVDPSGISRTTKWGRERTCYQTYSGAPTAEKMAAALMYLHAYPHCWEFWARNHGHLWNPRMLPAGTAG